MKTCDSDESVISSYKFQNRFFDENYYQQTFQEHETDEIVGRKLKRKERSNCMRVKSVYSDDSSDDDSSYRHQNFIGSRSSS